MGTWWPLWASLVVVFAMIFIAFQYPSWRIDPWGGLSAAATWITAGAAISIPLIIDQNARATRTLDQLNDLDRKIVDALTIKQNIDKSNKKRDGEEFNPEYIKSDAAVQGAVYRILNDYEYVCLGANQGLFISDLIKTLRWDALASTFVDYRQFMIQHRKQNKRQAEAWTECDKWLAANPHPTIR